MSTSSTTVAGVTTVTSPVTQFLGQDVQVASSDGTVGFYGTTPVAKPTVTGARDETEGALANLLAALASLGIITNSTTAS
jgi:hypothetical protein